MFRRARRPWWGWCCAVLWVDSDDTENRKAFYRDRHLILVEYYLSVMTSRITAKGLDD